MIFDMLKRLRSVVYLPNDYVCKKVSCMGLQGWEGVCSPSRAAMLQRSPGCLCQVVPKLPSHRGTHLAEKGWWGSKPQNCCQDLGLAIRKVDEGTGQVNSSNWGLMGSSQP